MTTTKFIETIEAKSQETHSRAEYLATAHERSPVEVALAVLVDRALEHEYHGAQAHVAGRYEDCEAADQRAATIRLGAEYLADLVDAQARRATGERHRAVTA